MKDYAGFLISFCLLIYCVLNNIYIGYALTACWILFALISYKKGYSLKEITKMSYAGGKKSFIVIKILILIGAIISIWMASGTIPAIIYYCLYYMNPRIFILSAFIICCITSFIIGTALGTVSTVGIPLIIIARSGNISLNIVAGAIIAGAYFGDRCSPMSSSAALVSNLTRTDIFKNIKNMLRSSIVPLILTASFYYILSLQQPLTAIDSSLPKELIKVFNIKFILLLPAIIILVLSLCKVKTEFSIPISILCAAMLCLTFQSLQLKQVVYYMLFGFKTNSSPILENIIKGGGIFSMLKTCLVIFVSCCLAGIFQGTKIFDNLKVRLAEAQLSRASRFGAASVMSMLTAAFGCSQSIAVIMTSEILNESYNDDERYQLALDLENSGILLSALIPWNFAALIPTTTMNVSSYGYIPYAFYLYILPVIYFVCLKYSSKDKYEVNCIDIIRK